MNVPVLIFSLEKNQKCFVKSSVPLPKKQRCGKNQGHSEVIHVVAHSDCICSFLRLQTEEASFLTNAHVTLEVICIIHPTLRVEKCPCLRNKRQSYWGISLGCILKILLGSTLLNFSRHYRSVCYPSLREFSWPAWTAVKFSSRKFMASPGKQYVTFEIHSAWVGEGHAAVEPLKRAQAAHRLVWSTDNIDFSSSIVLQSVALQRRKLLRWSQ